MTTTPETTAPAITEIGGNLFQLDALIEAYGEILEQAKAQLEAFEPSDDQFEKISNNLAHRIDHGRLAYELTRAIIGDPVSTYAARTVMDGLVQRVTERLDERHIRGMIRAELGPIISERFADLRIDLERMVKNAFTEEVITARTQRDALSNLMQRTFGDDMRRLASDAVREQLKQQEG